MSSPEVKLEIRLESGHLFFIDIVGYSKLLITEQTEQMQTLREIVRGTEQFRLAEAGQIRAGCRSFASSGSRPSSSPKVKFKVTLPP